MTDLPREAIEAAEERYRYYLGPYTDQYLARALNAALRAARASATCAAGESEHG